MKLLAKTAADLTTVWTHRFPLVNLVLKDFRIRYRHMSLGMLWSVLNPLVLLGVLSFVFVVLLRNPQPYFPVFVLLGLVMYNFFSLCLNAATSSVIDNAMLIKRVSFPRLIVPVSVVLSQLIHVVIQLALLGVFILIFQVPLRWTFLWLPVIYAAELLFVLGVALICSSLCVVYRDTRYLVESGLTILFWLTPIFYSLQSAHQNLPRALYAVYICNPLSGYIEAARRAVIYGVAPDMISLLIAVSVSLAALVAGLLVFTALEREFTDHL